MIAATRRHRHGRRGDMVGVSSIIVRALCFAVVIIHRVGVSVSRHRLMPMHANVHEACPNITQMGECPNGHERDVRAKPSQFIRLTGQYGTTCRRKAPHCRGGE